MKQRKHLVKNHSKLELNSVKVLQKFARQHIVKYFVATQASNNPTHMNTNQIKDDTVRFRVNSKKKNKIKEIASKKGLTLSAFILSAIDKEIQNEITNLQAA